MTRPLALVLALATTLTAHCQTLNACYQSGGELFCFNTNKQFDWILKSGPNTTYGSGNYTITNNTIQLNFGKTTRAFELELNESKPNNSSQANIEIRAIRSDGIPFEGLDIILQQSNLKAKTNHLGIGRLNLTNPPATDSLQIGFDGFTSSGLPIKLRGFDHVFGIVIDETTKYRENESLTLPFKQSRRKITLDGTSFKRLPHTKRATDFYIGT